MLCCFIISTMTICFKQMLCCGFMLFVVEQCNIILYDYCISL